MINKVTKIQTARRMQQARRAAKEGRKAKALELIIAPPLKRYIETKLFPRRAIKRTLNNPTIKKYLNLKILRAQTANKNMNEEALKLLSKLSAREKLLVKKLMNDESFMKKYEQTVPLSERVSERGLKFAQQAGSLGTDAALSVVSFIGQGAKKGAERWSKWHEQRQALQRQRNREREPRPQRPSRSPSPQRPPGFFERLKDKVKGGAKENDQSRGPYNRPRFSPTKTRPINFAS